MGTRVMVVINPSAGQPEPILSILNDAFAPAGVDWEVAVTHGSGDAFDAAASAREQGYDLVGAYGGDGTIAEVAAALAEGETPMALIPGGTGNALADELGIPRTAAEAAALVASGSYGVQRIDMGTDGEHWFVLRVTTGFEVAVLEAATPEQKTRLGWLAYALAGVQTLADPPVATYKLQIDGDRVECEGVACIVANSAGTGVLGLSLADDVSVTDGELDVLLVDRADLTALAAAVKDAASGQQFRGLTRWRAKRVRIESDPSQAVFADGEEAGCTPVELSVRARALGVVVPPRSG